jgi:hypothetical protein
MAYLLIDVINEVPFKWFYPPFILIKQYAEILRIVHIFDKENG